MIVFLKKIKLNFSLILLLSFSLISGVFKEIFIFILSLMFHELGHIFICLLFKVKIKSINFKIYGLSANLELSKCSNFIKVLVYISGVLFNLLLIIIFSFLDELKFNDLIININKILFLFNLLLIYPLDGYYIFNTFLQWYHCDIYGSKSFKISIYISLICLFIFFIISVYIKSLALTYISFVLFYRNIKKIKKRDEELMYKIFSLLT